MDLIASGGKTPFLAIWNITEFFTNDQILRQVYRLPEGFHSVSKVKFLRDSKRIALLTEGQFVIVKIEDESLKIEMSVKLANRAVIDFDVDS